MLVSLASLWHFTWYVNKKLAYVRKFGSLVNYTTCTSLILLANGINRLKQAVSLFFEELFTICRLLWCSLPPVSDCNSNFYSQFQTPQKTVQVTGHIFKPLYCKTSKSLCFSSVQIHYCFETTIDQTPHLNSSKSMFMGLGRCSCFGSRQSPKGIRSK